MDPTCVHPVRPFIFIRIRKTICQTVRETNSSERKSKLSSPLQCCYSTWAQQKHIVRTTLPLVTLALTVSTTSISFLLSPWPPFFFLLIAVVVVVVVGAVHLTARCQQWVFLFYIRAALYPAALTQKKPFLLHHHLLVQQCVVVLRCVVLRAAPARGGEGEWEEVSRQRYSTYTQILETWKRKKETVAAPPPNVLFFTTFLLRLLLLYKTLIGVIYRHWFSWLV